MLKIPDKWCLCGLDFVLLLNDSLPNGDFELSFWFFCCFVFKLLQLSLLGGSKLPLSLFFFAILLSFSCLFCSVSVLLNGSRAMLSPWDTALATHLQQLKQLCHLFPFYKAIICLNLMAEDYAGTSTRGMNWTNSSVPSLAAASLFRMAIVWIP
jgi:hypothetical protein